MELTTANNKTKRMIQERVPDKQVMNLYETTGETSFFDVGRHFWEIVTEGHIYCIGGTGETEMFHRAGTTCDYLTEKAAESCASYNMLRLHPFSINFLLKVYKILR